MLKRMIIALLLLLGSNALAQTRSGLKEFWVDAAFYSMRSGDESETIIDAQVGHSFYLHKMFALRVSGGFVKYGSDADPTYVIAVGPGIYFPLPDFPRCIPYIGAKVGMGSSGEDKTSMFFTIGSGVKLFTSEGGGAINFGPYYTYEREDNSDWYNSDTTLKSFGLSTGVSIFF